jgi:hypothetical protein
MPAAKFADPAQTKRVEGTITKAEMTKVWYRPARHVTKVTSLEVYPRPIIVKKPVCR